MDKYEFRVSLDEIDRLIEERRFGEAAAIADKIDWEKVRGTFTLCRISDLYKINKRYKDSRNLLEIAYERKPSSRKIIYSLCELELKLNNYIHALQLYNAFINVAPRDPDRFLLQYKLYKKQDVNVFEQISVLEEFLRRDFREKYAYELATLYLKAGDEQRCAGQCDEIVAYFGDGRFVIRALELKKSIMPLTPQQEEHLEILLSGGKYVPPSSANEEDASAGDAAARTAGETGQKTTAESGSGDGAETAPGSGEAGDGESESKAAAQEAAAMLETNPYSVQRTAATGGDGSEAGAEIEETEQESQKEQDTQDDRDDRTDSEQTGNPEEYTDTLLSDVKMQETIARGMREIDDYDSVLAQETSGQLAMVMEEESQEEAQTEGQLNLEQIMSEWEKIRRNSEQQRLAEARRRVMERSDAVKRELYGDDFSEESGETGENGEPVDQEDSGIEAEGDAQPGTTRSWDSEDVKRRMKK